MLSRTIKDGRVISLIHKYLNAGVISGGMFEKTETGMAHISRVKYLKYPTFTDFYLKVREN